MGELHLEIIVDRLKREFSVEASVGKPQVAYKETLTAPAEGRRPLRPPDRRPRPVRRRQDPADPAAAGHRLPVRERDRRRLGAARIHQADRSGHSGSAHARHPRRLSDRRRADRALRRVVPRGRLVGNGVQDCRLDGVPGCGQEGAPGAAWSRSCASRWSCRRITSATSWATSRRAAAASSRRRIAAARRSSRRACRSARCSATPRRCARARRAARPTRCISTATSRRRRTSARKSIARVQGTK